MDPIERTRLKARRAYELGRLRTSGGVTLLALAMLAVAFFTCPFTTLSCVVGAALLVFTIALQWRGQVFGRAVVPGLLAGSAPLVLPVLLRSGGHACMGGMCWSVCMVGCIGGGLLAGAMIGILSVTEGKQRFAFLSAATLLAGLAGVLGCATAGMAGIVGMVVAVLLSSIPVALVARLRVAA